MKTKSLFISSLLFAGTMTFTSCKKQPVASFTTSKTSVETGEQITFSNTSKDGVTYNWDFGDGTSSTSPSTTKTYTQTGNFTVQLTAYSKKEKKSDKATVNITVVAPDPCKNITCLNGGTCANGICNCPIGYTGSDCGIEKIPVSVTVSKIVLSNYPMTDGNGAGWDYSNGPDVFLSIDQGTSANDIAFSGTATDATGSSITYTTNFPVTFVSPSNNYTIALWDFDTPDADDFMGGIYFTPNSYKSGFPSTINLSYSSISMTLYVTWNF